MTSTEHTTTEPTVDAAATTVVKNQLLHPDGAPQKGVRVDLIARSNNSWNADGTGRIVGQVRTWTGPAGCWRQALLPYTAYHDEQYVYVEVREGQAFTGAIRVPPRPAETECWMWDLLVNPPPTPDGTGWRPISNLGDLGNVTAAANNPANGSLLTVQRGVWDTAPASVVGDALELEDVSNVAHTQAQPGQVLTAAAGGEPGTITWRALNLPDPHTPSKLTELADATGLSTAREGQFVTAHVTSRGVLTWVPVDPPTPPERLADLVDVSARAPSVGQRLTWNGTEWGPDALPEIPDRLGELADVETPAPSADEVLTWSGHAWTAQPLPSLATQDLDDLGDVDTTGATAGQVLTASAGAAPGTLVWRSLPLPSPHAPPALAELADTGDLAAASDGQFVTAHVDTAGALTWVPTSGPTVPHVVNDLRDVQAATPGEHGRVLMDDGTYWTAARPTLADAADVADTPPDDGQTLAWDSTAGQWVPVTPPDPIPAATVGVSPAGFPASAYGLVAASCLPREAAEQFTVYNSGVAVRLVVPAGVPVTGVTWWITQAFGTSNRRDCGAAVYMAQGASTATGPRGSNVDGDPSVFNGVGAKTATLTQPIPAASTPYEVYVVINTCYSTIGKVAAQAWPSNESLQYHATTSGYVRVGGNINWQVNSSSTWNTTVTVNPVGSSETGMPHVGLV